MLAPLITEAESKVKEVEDEIVKRYLLREIAALNTEQAEIELEIEQMNMDIIQLQLVLAVRRRELNRLRKLNPLFDAQRDIHEASIDELLAGNHPRIG